MPKYKKMPPLYPVPDTGIVLRPGERLADKILRSTLQGVSPEMSSTLEYDSDDSTAFDVDPNSDIRTDRFALAEHMSVTHARRAAASVNSAADVSAGLVAERVSSDGSDPALPSAPSNAADTSPIPAG